MGNVCMSQIARVMRSMPIIDWFDWTGAHRVSWLSLSARYALDSDPELDARRRRRRPVGRRTRARR
jgi:hypothetical protein